MFIKIQAYYYYKYMTQLAAGFAAKGLLISYDE